MSKKDASMKNATELIKWISTRIAQIVLWVEDGTRTVEELMPLKDAIQAVIERKPFDVVFREHVEESLKDLAISLNPSYIRLAWIKLYTKWGIRYVVPEVPFTIERIDEENERGRILIYLAPELSSTSALAELGKLFPKMQSWSVSSTDPDVQKIKSEDQSGWLFVEQALNMPNPNTTEGGLRKVFSRRQNVKGITLNAYIVFGQFCKEVFGEYPDAPGYVCLLGSSFGGYVLDAFFFQVGFLNVDHYWFPVSHGSCFGGRSVAM